MWRSAAGLLCQPKMKPPSGKTIMTKLLRNKKIQKSVANFRSQLGV